MLKLHAIKGPTGKLMAELLEGKRLLGGQIRGIVNYGYHGGDRELPTLNAKAGTVNKYEELVTMDDAGVRTVPFSLDADDLKAPFLGRKLHHTRGTDIVVFHGRPRQAMDYYTQLVPKAREFRVWVFRNKSLATYEKVLDYPARNGRRGRSTDVWNWHNGYAYHFVRPEDAADRLKDLAIRAVASLDLDFGAVDVLLGLDRHYYALEVNTAPGTQGEARQGVTSLVNCIERWANGGFQARREQ